MLESLIEWEVPSTRKGVLSTGRLCCEHLHMFKRCSYIIPARFEPLINTVLCLQHNLDRNRRNDDATLNVKCDKL